MTLIHDDELADAYSSIEKRGLDMAEFVFLEGKIEGPEDGCIGPLIGSVTITFKPTAVSKQHSTGHGTQWPYLFQTDLDRGAFF